MEFKNFVALLRSMDSLEWATWVLAVFTGVLAISTIFYIKSSNKHTKALQKLTQSVTEIPFMVHRLRTEQRLKNRLNKKRMTSSAQRRATTGRQPPQS